MTTKQRTQRTAKVSITWEALLDYTETIDIPDDVPPDQVDEWVRNYVEAERPQLYEFDDVWCSTYVQSIEGCYEPEPGTPEAEAWRLRAIPGQVDIFGGEVE